MDNSQRLDSSTLSKLTPQELKLYKLYGKLPNKKDLLNYKLKDNRKFFDSGDYHMKKEKEKQQPIAENVVPIYKPEQFKINRRTSIAADCLQEKPSSGNFVSESKMDSSAHDSPVSSFSGTEAGSTLKPRTRSNSLLNPESNSMPKSPLSKKS